MLTFVKEDFKKVFFVISYQVLQYVFEVLVNVN